MGLKSIAGELAALHAAGGDGFVVWWLESGEIDARADHPLTAGTWGVVAAGATLQAWKADGPTSLRAFWLASTRAWASRSSAWLWRTAQQRAVVAAQPLTPARAAWWRAAQDELVDGRSAGAVALELEALLWRLDRDLPVAQLQPGAQRAPHPALAAADARVETMVRHLVRHAHERLTVAGVCASAGLPAAHGAALFRRVTGVAMLTYLRRVRVAEACAQLAGTRRKVLDVALASGFGTASRFYEAFQREAGCSPQEYRRRGGHVGTSAPAGLAGGAGARPRPLDEAQGGRSPVMLWVDHAPANNFHERRFLHEIGVFTDCHLDNASALAAQRVQRAALIISDLNRPDDEPSGWDLVASLRVAGDATPVLFYTGAVTPALEARTRAAEAQGIFARSRPLIERVIELLGMPAT